MTTASFTDSFLLLQQEGQLFRSCLSHGFMALRKAHAGEKGLYFTAFFLLSTGLERVMKTVLILDHMRQHDLVPPSSAELRSYGHDLMGLFDNIRRMTVSSARHPLNQFEAGSIERQILEHLSDFGSGARYFNLDSLLPGCKRPDPLARWNRVVTRILVEDIPATRLARLRLQCKGVVATAADNVRMTMHDLERVPLSVENAVEVATLTYAAAFFAIYRIYLLLEALKLILEDATNRVMRLDHSLRAAAPAVPFMHEFLEFGVLDKQAVLRKRTWA